MPSDTRKSVADDNLAKKRPAPPPPSPRLMASIVLLVITGVLLVGLQMKVPGWLACGLGVLSLLRTERDRAKAVLLPFILLAILGITPIGTELSNEHMARMGLALIAAIVVPSLLDRRWLAGAPLIRYPWRTGRAWTRREWGYIIATVVIAYFLFPYYLRESGAYLNWAVDRNAESVSRLFIGTNAVGLWDELAFIIVCLSVLRTFLPFRWANLVQAILFTSFLYELGFTSWGVIFIFPFALVQGLIFRMTESLAYVVTVHLSLDFVLFLAIINAHHPQWCAIFIT
jgi:membrane protease YdiL (CAAX protease family)